MISVVLPVRDGAATIAAQLDALTLQSPSPASWELVVVDNGSTDDTAGVVGAYAERLPLRVVDAPLRANLAYARNAGVNAAVGDKIAFCDADDVVGDGWLAAVDRALETHPIVGYRFEWDRLNDPGDLVGRHRFQANGLETFFGQQVVSGAMAVVRTLWDELGGNNEQWSFTGEDYEFCLRAFRQLGVVGWFEPQALYHVRMRSSVGATFRQARRYGRAHVALFSEFVEDRPSAWQRAADGARAWWWIVTRVPVAVVRPTRRTLWARRAGVRLGRLTETLRSREFLP